MCFAAPAPQNGPRPGSKALGTKLLLCSASQPSPHYLERILFVSGQTRAEAGGLVWFGSRLAPKAVTHGRCARTSLARLGTPLGCLVSQPPRLLTIPEPRQGADVRETPPCLYVWARVLGGGGTSGHTTGGCLALLYLSRLVGPVRWDRRPLS